jgi:SAM-dependent methyltransferase
MGPELDSREFEPVSSDLARAEGRSGALGQHHRLTRVDRFGMWLSSRSLRKAVGDASGKRLGDFGCGFEARTSRPMATSVSSRVLVDLAVSDELKADPKVIAFEGRLPQAMGEIPDASLDITLCMSVVEHLTEPDRMLSEMRRVTAPGGVCVINVPTWRGKWFLEFSAFRLALSPAEEMDDHKTYYDPKDLWPLLVRAGFLPHGIKCRRHKFGLNTLAVCRVDARRAPL